MSERDDDGEDEYAATCRSIVRAAAAIRTAIMTDRYVMNVRAAEKPHEVLGTLRVPLAAMQGEMMRVRFEGSLTAFTLARHDKVHIYELDVQRFFVRGLYEHALVFPRDKWSELSEKLA